LFRRLVLLAWGNLAARIHMAQRGIGARRLHCSAAWAPLPCGEIAFKRGE
jgi:hypothetical protein